MKFVLAIIIMSFSISAFASTKSSCNLNNLEKDMVYQMGLSPDQAHGYRLSLENYILNLKLAGIALASVYVGDLDQIRIDLIKNFGLTTTRADAIVTSMKMVRLFRDETLVFVDGCGGR
jgi:hypothetical protein